MKYETITIRLPVGLRKIAADMAEAENRSMNGQIVHLIQAASKAKLNEEQNDKANSNTERNDRSIDDRDGLRP